MIPILFAAALNLAPCTIAGANARCGTFDVPESAGSKRTLHLKLIVLPATERNESPNFLMAGGPGERTTPSAEIAVKYFAAERRLHDIVLLDERGTEGSALCPEAVKKYAKSEIEDDLFPPFLVQDCRKEIEKHNDPAHFTFNDFSDDVEALRQALGYGPINIIGLSYGTRAALTFESRNPKSVRSMVLWGPLPPDNVAPLNFARDAQTVMDKILPRADLQKAFVKLPQDIKSGGYTIHMTRGAFAEFLRSYLYTVDKQQKIPEIVRNATAGNWSAIAPDFIKYRQGWYDDLGVFLSVTCPTDVRNISMLEVGPGTARSFLGDYRVLQQMTACKIWTPGTLEKLHVSTAPVPILIFVGDRDAITPKRWADALSTEVLAVHTVVLQNAGHADFENACAADLETKFLDAGSFDKFPAECAAKP